MHIDVYNVEANFFRFASKKKISNNEMKMTKCQHKERERGGKNRHFIHQFHPWHAELAALLIFSLKRQNFLSFTCVCLVASFVMFIQNIYKLCVGYF